MDFLFFLNSILFGVGLAMDAFSVSVVNGLNEPGMRYRRRFLIAGIFGFFQALMPLLGWVLVHTVVSVFTVTGKFVPFIALGLLLFLGIQMIVESVRKKEEEESHGAGGVKLFVQGIATSIDALSVGLTIASLPWYDALVESLIIGTVTFGICFFGVSIGRKFGTVLKRKAGIVGGVILILIGIEIFVKSLLGF